jgi:hypothetical protein
VEFSPSTPTTEWRLTTVTRAIQPELLDTVWAAIKGLLPAHVEHHPLDCQRRGVPDRDCFKTVRS